MIDILVIPISNPMLIGVYKDEKFIMSYKNEEKTSDILPIIFEKILNKYSIQGLYFVNAPGSYMSIKVAYIFLKTLSIAKNIDLKATIGFHFNQYSPIRALGKKYFFYKNEEISIDFLEDTKQIGVFNLPTILNKGLFSYESLPKYNLPAV